MKLQRILVAAPRMWPWCDDGSLRLMHWTESLGRMGHRVTIVTPRWDHSWPNSAVCREVPLFRLLPAPRTSWNQLHYLRALGKWVAAHRHQFDLLYVDEPLGMLHQLTQSRPVDPLPVIGRFHAGPLDQQMEFNNASALQQTAEGCRKLTKVIVPDANSDRRLRAAGIADDKIVRIPDVAWYQVHRDPALKQVAIRALSKISSDLMLPRNTRLLLVMGSVEQKAGLLELCRGIGALLDGGMALRTWIIGTGPFQRPLHDFLRDMAWHRDILLQGSFDSIDELLQLADLCLFPSAGQGVQFYQPMTVASGIPALFSDSPDRRALLGSDDRLYFQPSQDGIREKLMAWYQNPLSLREATESAQHHFHNTAPMQSACDRWHATLSSL